MTWKNAIHRAIKKEMQPMRQITHWVLFLSTGLIYVLKTVESAAAASYDILIQNPDIASASWLTNTWFL